MADDNCPPLTEILPNQLERQQVEKEIENLIFSDFQSSSAAAGALGLFRDPGNDANGRNLSQSAFADWLKQFAGVPFDQSRLDRRDFDVPDIASRRNLPKPNTNEFYEIKPDTNNGSREATAKIAGIIKLITELRLLFVPGIDYDPPGGKKITVSTTVGAVDFELTLSWKLQAPGIILYKVCLKAKQKQEVKEGVSLRTLGLLALVALAILFAILFGVRGGMRMPVAPPVVA
jgi:hypothetical protein